MKIRHPWLIKLFGFVISWVIRVWIGTVRYRYLPLGKNNLPIPRGSGSSRYIYTFWHENMLIPAHHYGRSDFWILISAHADGRLIAEVCRHLGFRVVTGSTTRGGVEALRGMMRAAKNSYVGITPDGPRGPRHVVKPGVIYLASRTGLPIVPTVFAYTAAIRLRSWDRMALPLPFSAVTHISGEPIHVPDGLDKDQLEHYRRLLETAMERATEAAERIVGRPAGAKPTWPEGTPAEARTAA
jgi:lysophospholipid acyltransferase (LPLAT)-like uncharacterized protein